MKYFSLIFIPLLVHVFYTDFIKYKVHVLALILLSVLSIARLIVTLQPAQYIETLGLNFILLAVLLLAVALTARLRKKSFMQMMGLGDIFLLAIAALNFAPLNFNLFIVIATLASMVFIVVRLFKNQTERRIPFAGVMADRKSVV